MALTSLIRYIKVADTSSTTGVGKTGLVFSDFTAKYNIEGGTLTSLTTETITTLGTYQAPTSAAHIRIKEVNSADPTKGVYEIHFHNTQLATGNVLWLYLSATGTAIDPFELDLSNLTGRTPLALVGGRSPSDLQSIDGQVTSGNNATLYLKQLNIVNSAGSALVASATGSNGDGIAASGNGTGSGLKTIGGTTGRGFWTQGGATSGAGLYIEAVAGNSVGFSVFGFGAGAGMRVEGGATGTGMMFIGGATSGTGFAVSSTSGQAFSCAATNGNGILVTGGGTGSGVRILGGATGIGLAILGGATSGDGIDISTTDGDGIDITTAGGGKVDIDADISGTVSILSTDKDTFADLVFAEFPVSAGGHIEVDVLAVDGSITAATQLRYTALTSHYGSVAADLGNSETSFKTDLTETVDDYYGDANGGNIIVFISLTDNAIQGRRISGYDGTNKIITVESPFDAIPDNGDKFVILGRIEV